VAARSTAFSQPRLLGTILSKYADRYNADTITLPFPPDAPGDVPRIILQSQDARWKLQGGPHRIDSFWLSQHETDTNTAAVDECVTPQAEYISAIETSISRAALVLTHAAWVDNAPHILVELFSAPEARNRLFQDLSAFEIHSVKRQYMDSANMFVNSLVHCRTAFFVGTNAPLVTVQHEIVIADEQDEISQLNGEKLLEFSHHAAREIASTLSLYFPERA